MACSVGPTEVPVQDPCPFGLPEVLTAAHTGSRTESTGVAAEA